ncbi:tyrosine- kinase yes [Brachionus plicatilis]|uniref:Tyrosine-kinase yes n=1 Tax=Brachionus plicatilis TaxID=10195 RepID=A0A3M7Q3N2_BRAPC|nr:tyrosine- kinase yes [Brachionus plicatilis]
MGNICPANKGTDNHGGHHAYKTSSNREQVYKLGIQKGNLENATSGLGPASGHHQYPLMNHSPNLINSTNNQNMLLQQLHHQNGMPHTQNGSFCSTTAILNGMSNSLLTQSSSNQIANNKHILSAGIHSNSLLEKPNYIALFDYESATKDDMTIKKNDQLIVIDKSHPDWWLAKNIRTKETGYVPFNYITTIDDLQIKE